MADIGHFDRNQRALSSTFYLLFYSQWTFPEGMENGKCLAHYLSHKELPLEAQKYFHQRYDIFSKYDEGNGVFMTDDAWFGVTPEPIANNIATHVEQLTPSDRTVLIDAFAGVGGNTIAFARSGRWEQIFAIEKDSSTLECAKRNARLYGVEKRIWWILGDTFDVLQRKLSDIRERAVIFASPPWGGPGYGESEIFNLESMEPYGLQQLCHSFFRSGQLVVLYLPRTSNLRQLSKYTQTTQNMLVIHYCLKGASRAICAYMGPFEPAEDNLTDSEGKKLLHNCQ